MPLIVQPDTLASMLADIERRLEALERSPGIRDSVVAQDAQNPPVTRVGIGRLDTIFPSAGYASGTYGMRVQDASGASILDTLGLQAVMKDAGHMEYTTPQNVTMGTGTNAIPNSGFSFTVPRAGLSVLLLGTISAQITANNPGNPWPLLYFQTTGQARSPRGTIGDVTNSLGFASQDTVTLFQLLPSLAAGNYSGSWYFVNGWGAGQAMTFGDIALNAFLLGS